MEITIDVSTVRRIAGREYDLACADLAELGPVRAYERSQQRHDQRLASASDAATLACRDGCYWCCYFTVDVRPVEVLRILDFVENELSASEQQRVRSEIAANSVVLRQLDETARMQRNIKCPFLAAGRCTIYAARPQTCRNYHATNAAGCQKSFEEPENLDIDPDFAPLVYQSGGAHVDAFSQAMRDNGYEVTALELNIALAAAMLDPAAARQRFEARQQPFAGVQGVDVPMEFIDDED